MLFNLQGFVKFGVCTITLMGWWLMLKSWNHLFQWKECGIIDPYLGYILICALAMYRDLKVNNHSV